MNYCCRHQEIDSYAILSNVEVLFPEIRRTNINIFKEWFKSQDYYAEPRSETSVHISLGDFRVFQHPFITIALL